MSTVVVGQCVRALHDSDIRVRIQAVGALVAIGTPVVESLIASLGEANPVVRWRALVALGWIGDARAVEVLLNSLSDMVWEVRQSAAWALGQIGDRRAANDLHSALFDDDEQVCVLAAYALARLNESERLTTDVCSPGEQTRRAASAALSLIANEVQPVRSHMGIQTTAFPDEFDKIV